MSNWLQELKPGDQVIADHGVYNKQVVVVERLTATQIVAGKSKYNRKTGYAVGESGWRRSSLNRASPEAIEALQRHNYISRLSRLDARRLRSLDTETLRAAVETLHTNAKPVE